MKPPRATSAWSPNDEAFVADSGTNIYSVSFLLKCSLACPGAWFDMPFTALSSEYSELRIKIFRPGHDLLHPCIESGVFGCGSAHEYILICARGKDIEAFLVHNGIRYFMENLR